MLRANSIKMFDNGKDQISYISITSVLSRNTITKKIFDNGKDQISYNSMLRCKKKCIYIANGTALFNHFSHLLLKLAFH